MLPDIFGVFMPREFRCLLFGHRDGKLWASGNNYRCLSTDPYAPQAPKQRIIAAVLSNVRTINEILYLIWDTSTPDTFPLAFINEPEPDQSQQDSMPSLCALDELKQTVIFMYLLRVSELMAVFTSCASHFQ